MNDFLNYTKIEYILYHLGFVIHIDESVRNSFVFLKDKAEAKRMKNKIIFILSAEEFDITRVKWKKNIPVLFPVGDEDVFYTQKGGNIIFSDDLLRSAFFLLTGYQEYENTSKDKFGRFPFLGSVQHDLNITGVPVVNYYFYEVGNGIRAYCEQHDLPFREKKPFDSFGFILSHDIDKIEKYSWSYIGYKVKEITGFVRSQYSWMKTLRLLSQSAMGYLGVTSHKNPFWTFEYIRSLNQKFGFRSTYFFLPRDKKNADADYDLDEKRLLDLYPVLLGAGDEIGIHGTVASSLKRERALENKKNLENITGTKINGIRQHRLCYQLPETSRIHEAMGYIYDNTLGFAEHVGFRNSYCLPFHLYDFEYDRMFGHWQIPLNVMDVSLFAYQKFDTFVAREAISNLLGEISKFGGLFSLLWHNTYLDENEFRGIRSFYESVLEEVNSRGGVSFTATEAINSFLQKN